MLSLAAAAVRSITPAGFGGKCLLMRCIPGTRGEGPDTARIQKGSTFQIRFKDETMWSSSSGWFCVLGSSRSEPTGKSHDVDNCKHRSPAVFPGKLYLPPPSGRSALNLTRWLLRRSCHCARPHSELPFQAKEYFFKSTKLFSMCDVTSTIGNPGPFVPS